MRQSSRTLLRRGVCALVSVCMLVEPLALFAAQLNLVKSPLFVAPPIPPLVMLDISKDQQLYKKAYNDYSDLDGDNVLETTYKHSIDYYGYFDSYKCYSYGTSTLSSSNHFVPQSWTSDKYCNGSTWSGNFLNWVSMSRMDAVRKLLFGGARNTDRSTPLSGYGSLTIIERTYLPTDAHSWAKYYNGNDINRLTPFNPATTTTRSAVFDTQQWFCGSIDPVTPISPGSYIYFCNMADTVLDNIALGDQLKLSTEDGTKHLTARVIDFGKYGAPYNYIGVQIDSRTGVDSSGNSLAGGTATPTRRWTITNVSSTGISFCNTTLRGGNQFSQDNTQPPLMRVVRGNFELWSANERWQCYIREERSSQQNWATSNGNQAQLSGLNAAAENPSRDGYWYGNTFSPTRGLGSTDYTVRVETCHNAFYPPPTGQRSSEKCKQYDQAGYYKPIGLLQVYGEDGRILYGLMTGSYNKNVSGGVLRKNVSDLSTEITSSGVFVNDPTTGNIIRNLSRMRIYGYDYDDGSYIAADNCSYQITSTDLTNGRCRSWGNPMSEIYAESIRYFAGATAPTAAYDTDDFDLFPSARIRKATWPNPNNVITNNNYCAPLNILVFNASVSSKDSDEVSNPFVGVAGTPVAMTDTVGTAEGVPGTSFFIGSNGLSSNNLCDAKAFTSASGNNLGSAQGLCPEAPSLNGSFLMAGLAHTARTNRIRNDLTAVPTTDTRSLKVATYGISLATNVPRIEAVAPGGRKIIIQPAYRLDLGSRIGAGSIVDVKVVPYVGGVCPTGYNCGSMYVNWEDSEQGGDFDQDVWGIISYQLSNSDVRVTTNVIAASTANPQGFGYVISGTTKDGPHFHSGILGFNFTDSQSISATPTTKLNSSGGCSNCNPSLPPTDAPTTATYSLSSSSAASSFLDPLWYAAKFGGFTDSNGNALPDIQTEWDKTINATGALGSDGIPDNFFQVTNPLGLELALDRLFISILQAAAASAVAANSSRLNTSTRIYQAVFNPSDWSGKMLAFGVNTTTGAPNSTPDWDGGQVSLNAFNVVPNNRAIITTNRGVTGQAPRGIPFRYPGADPSVTTPNPATSLTPAQIAALRTNPDTNSADTVPSPWSASTDPGSMRLNYLRGDGTNEGLASTNYRRRATTKLGDVVNSNPNFVGPPNSGYPDNLESASYSAFVTANRNRKPVLYVGANDGMLHGFNACPPDGEVNRPTACSGSTLGAELLAFVPSQIYRTLSKLTSRGYQHEYYVDGSPAVEDAFVGSAWKSVLVGGMNRGGQSIYALDVTNPENFSESNAASLVMWEFTDADDPDLGYTFGTPLIRKMANGKWAAIVSGGYNNSQGTTNDAAEVQCTAGSGTSADPYTPAGCTTSRNGQGFIFVIFLDGPTGTNGQWRLGIDYVKLATGTGYGSASTPNGLGSPFAADVDGDAKVDLIYAGDLLGNVWRFDMTSTTPSTWAIDGSRLRLFTATVSGSPSTVQPITAGMEGVLHPSGKGVLVSFGTGKYLEATDVASPFTTQTIYGIWDKGGTTADRADSATVPGRSTGSLMQQSLQGGITNIFTNPDGSVSRITTKYQPNYTAASRTDPDTTLWDGASALEDRLNAVSPVQTTPVQLGWALDLFNAQSTGIPSGERIIYAPFVRNGIVFYSSLWPLSNTCVGSTAGDNITLKIVTGARPEESVFDTDANQLVNSSDMVTVTTPSGATVRLAVSSKRIEGGSAQPPTLVSRGSTGGAAGSENFQSFQNPTGGTISSFVTSFGRGPGRVSWREILY